MHPARFFISYYFPLGHSRGCFLTDCLLCLASSHLGPGDWMVHDLRYFPLCRL